MHTIFQLSAVKLCESVRVAAGLYDAMWKNGWDTATEVAPCTICDTVAKKCHKTIKSASVVDVSSYRLTNADNISSNSCN